MRACLAAVALFCYFIATLHYLLFLVSHKVKLRLGKLAAGATLLGFAAHSGVLILQTIQYGHLPVFSSRASISFFAWSIVLVYLVMRAKYKTEIFGSFALPLALLASIYSSLLPHQIEPLISSTEGLFIALHAAFAFIGFASFAFAVCAAVMYLIQERQLKSKHPGGTIYNRLPSLETLEHLSYKAISIGFPVLTVAVILGLIWAIYTRSSLVNWRFKEVWWFLIWLAYAVLLQARLTMGWRGRRAAYVAISVFVLACIPLLI